MRRYLSDADETTQEPDAVILGCTHFPLLKSTFTSVFSDSVAIVDSASTTATAASEMLAGLSLRNDLDEAGSLRLLATDGATRFARVGGQFLGTELSAKDVTIVDL